MFRFQIPVKKQQSDNGCKPAYINKEIVSDVKY